MSISSQAIRLNKMIADEAVHDALETLRKTAQEIGHVRKRMVLSAQMVKHVEALMMGHSDARSGEMRKAFARSSDKYLAAIEEEAEAAGEFEKLKAVREHASSIIEAWRTQESNLRGVRV